MGVERNKIIRRIVAKFREVQRAHPGVSLQEAGGLVGKLMEGEIRLLDVLGEEPTNEGLQQLVPGSEEHVV